MEKSSDKAWGGLNYRLGIAKWKVSSTILKKVRNVNLDMDIWPGSHVQHVKPKQQPNKCQCQYIFNEYYVTEECCVSYCTVII
jgi:hypothetical protein